MPNLRDYMTRARDAAQTIGVSVTSFLDSFKNESNNSNRSRRRRSRSRRSQNRTLGPPHLHRPPHYSRIYYSHESSRHHFSSSLPGSYRCGERNLWAALMSLLVIATLSAAIAQPKWLSIRGGRCDRVYIGLQEFYMEPFTLISHDQRGGSTSDDPLIPENPIGQMDKIALNKALRQGGARIIGIRPASNLNSTRKKGILTLQDLTESFAYPSISLRSGRAHISCITPVIVHLQRIIIILCFSSLLLNLFQFFLDTLGTKRRCLEHIRRHAIANLIGVVSCILTLGFAYLIADLLDEDQRRIIRGSHYMGEIADHDPPNVEIHFEISFYLISLAGLLGLIAAACNLLAKPKPFFLSSSPYFAPPYDSEANNLLEESISPRWQPSFPPPLPTLSAYVPSSINMPPPPPYSP